MHAIFREVSRQRIRVLTSAVTLAETLMKPLKEKDTALISRYRTMFYRTRGLSLISASPRIGESTHSM